MAGNPENPNCLIVEGHDDKYCVANLLGAHIAWPSDKNKAPIRIELGSSADEILSEGYLSTYLKSPTIKRLGVMFDADANPLGRYGALRARCSSFFPAMPAELPKGGLTVTNDENKRFGTWIMPDNVATGDLELFLKCLVPLDAGTAWLHAVTSVERAKSLGCGCRDTHRSKANLYTWLAWQDPPGQSPGRALMMKILDPASPGASVFVAWFRKLYEV